jgi:predicted SprT family Zn-dependent metalloprotease
VELPATDWLELRVAELFRVWRVPSGPAVSVGWNPRLQTTAGRAFAAENRIELNPELLGDWPDEIPAILGHEAAHVAAHRLFGPRVAAHGRHWRALMRLVGLPPEIAHDMPVRTAARRRRSFLYLRICARCGERRVARVVRDGVCRCGANDRYLVLRAAASAQGLAMLRAMSLSEVRRRCIMPGQDR